MKRFASIVMMSGLAFVATAAMAQQQPVRDISAKRHPNLARAQKQTDAAYQSIVAAQQANEFDLGGHAQKAKDLLDQANRELKQAAEVSNANH
jgi:hypothetical protein